MPSAKNVESTLIHFKHGTAGNWKEWTTELETFLHRTLVENEMIDTAHSFCVSMFVAVLLMMKKSSDEKENNEKKGKEMN